MSIQLTQDEIEFNRKEAKAIATKRQIRDLVREYISEAEHGDGYGYWGNFNNLKEIFEDMARYAAGKENLAKS